MLREELKPAIRTKRLGLLSKGVTMSYDNDQLHTAVRTVESVCQQKFEVLKHLSYNHGLVPSDCHLFGALKGALRGRHFASDQEVNQPEKCFSEGIQKLMDGWTKCVEDGVYIGK
jgi:hypothetical protein